MNPELRMSVRVAEFVTLHRTVAEILALANAAPEVPAADALRAVRGLTTSLHHRLKAMAGDHKPLHWPEPVDVPPEAD